MRARSSLSITAVLILIAGPLCAEQTKVRHLSRKQFHTMVLKEHFSNTTSIEGFANLTHCIPAIFQSADLLAGIEQDNVQQEMDGGDSWALSDGQNVASEFNELAAVEEKLGCRELAKQTYLKVIETYIGSGYEAMRQRAQIGIDDLRSTQSAAPLKALPDGP